MGTLLGSVGEFSHAHIQPGIVMRNKYVKRTVFHGRDPIVEQGKRVRSPPSRKKEQQGQCVNDN